MPEKDELKYTTKDIPSIIEKNFKPMTDSNIQPPTNTTGEVLADGTVGWPTEETTPNPVPGTEVTQSPGLIPETTAQIPGYDPNTATAPAEYDPASANVDTAVPPNTYVENDGTTGPIATPPGQPDITEVPPTDYADAVDYQVDSMSEAGHHPEMPVYTETETAHQNLMQNPQYAIATHEHTLNKFADLLEQIVGRLNDIEAKLDNHITDVTGPDPNDPLAAYPEVQAHQNK